MVVFILFYQCLLSDLIIVIWNEMTKYLVTNSTNMSVFQPLEVLEVVDRGSETQPQVVKK